jgi:hypothetical protein
MKDFEFSMKKIGEFFDRPIRRPEISRPQIGTYASYARGNFYPLGIDAEKCDEENIKWARISNFSLYLDLALEKVVSLFRKRKSLDSSII